jgi:hypothetical protein
MTFSTASAVEGSTIMATTARIARVLLIAAGILALSVTAAQARPIGVGYTASSVSSKAAAMSPAVDPANAQQVPIVVTQAVPQPVKASASGFNWTASMLGAGTATLVLLLAGFAASSSRPRRVVQL